MDAAMTKASLNLNTGQLVVNINKMYLSPVLDGVGPGHLVEMLVSLMLKPTLDHWHFPADGNHSRTASGSHITKTQTETSQFFLEHPPLLNLTIDCDWLSDRSHGGQGNWIIVFYLARMAAALAQVDMQLQCLPPDPNSTRTPVHWRSPTPWIPWHAVVPSTPQ